MTPKISLITPTYDRPFAFELCERWMRRQTMKWDEWIVADGASTFQETVTATMGQRVLWTPNQPGASNFLVNLAVGVQAAKGDILIIIENDDWYSPFHIETIVGQLSKPNALIAGDDLQRYYNMPLRLWRHFNNIGASLCQTGMRRWVLDLFQETIAECQAKGSYGVDTKFWTKVPKEFWSLHRGETVLGVKGLPGQVGLGIGHRPSGGWTSDPETAQLREWIGEDVSFYE